MNTGCMMVVSFSGTSISRNMAFYIYLRSKWNADLRASPVPGVPGLCFCGLDRNLSECRSLKLMSSRDLSDEL